MLYVPDRSVELSMNLSDLERRDQGVYFSCGSPCLCSYRLIIGGENHHAHQCRDGSVLRHQPHPIIRGGAQALPILRSLCTPMPFYVE